MTTRSLAHAGNLGQDEEINRDAEEREAGDQHAGDRAGAERDGEAGCQALARSLGRAHVGAHRHHHAREARGAGQERADEEADGDGERQEPRDDDEDDDADGRDGRVLPAQVRSRTLLDGRGNFLHAGRTGIRRQNFARRPDAVGDADEATQDDQINHGSYPSVRWLRCERQARPTSWNFVKKAADSPRRPWNRPWVWPVMKRASSACLGSRGRCRRAVSGEPPTPHDHGHRKGDHAHRNDRKRKDIELFPADRHVQLP